MQKDHRRADPTSADGGFGMADFRGDAEQGARHASGQDSRLGFRNDVRQIIAFKENLVAEERLELPTRGL